MKKHKESLQMPQQSPVKICTCEGLKKKKRVTGYKVWINDLLIRFTGLFHSRTVQTWNSIWKALVSKQTKKTNSVAEAAKTNLRAALFLCHTGMLCCAYWIYIHVYKDNVDITFQRSQIAKHDYILPQMNATSPTVDQLGQLENRKL